MWDRYGTDDLSHGLATLTAKEKDGTDGTDVFFKKKRMKEETLVRRCKKEHLHHWNNTLRENNGGFHCPICASLGLKPVAQGNGWDR